MASSNDANNMNGNNEDGIHVKMEQKEGISDDKMQESENLINQDEDDGTNVSIKIENVSIKIENVNDTMDEDVLMDGEHKMEEIKSSTNGNDTNDNDEDEPIDIKTRIEMQQIFINSDRATIAFQAHVTSQFIEGFGVETKDFFLRIIGDETVDQNRDIVKKIKHFYVDVIGKLVQSIFDPRYNERHYVYYLQEFKYEGIKFFAYINELLQFFGSVNILASYMGLNIIPKSQ